MKLTVIIPTHNPRPEIFGLAIQALKAQSLPVAEWNLIVVDNASNWPLNSDCVSWHPQGRIVRESQLGLTYARLRGIHEAEGDVMVWVDDDNILGSDYLSEVAKAFAGHPELGAAGGKAIFQYLEKPPAWHQPGLAPLGGRDLGELPIWLRWDSLSERAYPAAAPIGAGMATRTIAIKEWAKLISEDPVRRTFGRNGSKLTSGEDNDINLTLLGAGWELAYLPQLYLHHVMPPGRLTLDYQKRISCAANRDFIRVLDLHAIRPWTRIARWTIPLRVAKAWVRLRAWRGPIEQIHWYSAIGQFLGRALLKA